MSVQRLGMAHVSKTCKRGAGRGESNATKAIEGGAPLRYTCTALPSRRVDLRRVGALMTIRFCAMYRAADVVSRSRNARSFV